MVVSIVSFCSRRDRKTGTDFYTHLTFFGDERFLMYVNCIFFELSRYIIVTVRGHTEVRVELQMERWAARGGSVRLRCVHDVPPHLLDKVVFLRHGTKIFQYIRDRKPPYRNFTTPGAVLNVRMHTFGDNWCDDVISFFLLKVAQLLRNSTCLRIIRYTAYVYNHKGFQFYTDIRQQF